MGCQVIVLIEIIIIIKPTQIIYKTDVQLNKTNRIKRTCKFIIIRFFETFFFYILLRIIVIGFKNETVSFENRHWFSKRRWFSFVSHNNPLVVSYVILS